MYDISNYRNPPPHCSNDTLPRHLMSDQDDISISGHSIGIVENPMFGETDELDKAPTYAALSAKEKEAEVRLTCYMQNNLPIQKSYCSEY